MSDMRSLLESMNKFAGQAVGQKPGDQVRGSEPMPKKGGKQHPFKGRLVGASESIETDDLTTSLQEEFDQYVAEYGAPGSAIGIKQIGADPQAYAAQKQQERAQQAEAGGQIQELQAQLAAARAQIAQINKAFPQGANPVEKAMALRDMNAQRTQLSRQVEDLTYQIAALRRQA
jgi:hypothetical protein